MPEYDVPMTLVVEAEDERAALSIAAGLEPIRENFEKPYVWLHVTLSPKAEAFWARLKEEAALDADQRE